MALPALLAGGAALFGIGKSLFGNKGGNRGQLPNFFDAKTGLFNQGLVDQLSLSGQDTDRMLDDLFRSISTHTAAGANRINELSARENLPADTQLSALRGNQIAGAQETARGRSDILNRQAFSRIDAIRMLLALQNQNQQAALNRGSQEQAALLNAIFQAASVAGAGGFGGGG